MDNNKHICKYCGKIFETGRQLGGHISRCAKNPNIKNTINKIVKTKKQNNPQNEYNINCIICSNTFTLTLTDKQFKHGNYRKTCCKECALKLTAQNTDNAVKNEKISKNLKGRYLKENVHIERYCVECNSLIPIERHNSKFCSDKCKEKHWKEALSESLKGKTGGYRILSGNKKHKSGKYDGIYFDSSWELAFYVYCIENNINISRCKEVRSYIYNDKQYKYYPDFQIQNKIIEIKGYITEKTKCKIEQNPDIIVLFFDDIKHCIEYCQTKYGNNYWEVLYENMR